MEQHHVPVVASHGGESRTVDVNCIFTWLERGWSMFVAEPVQWLLMTLVLLVIMLGLSVIPLVGSLAAMLLTPVFVAGMLCTAQRVANDEAPSFDDLFAGFRQNLNSLIILGALYTAMQLLIILVMFVVIGGGVLGGALRGDMSGVGLALGTTLIGSVVLAPILMVPLCMAMWFAPALVFFEKVQPVAAIKASFEACWKNILPFAVYGLLMFLASIVAALPFMLGFLVLLPVLFGSMLASYREIFVSAPSPS